MNMKFHYMMTFLALIFLGLVITHPRHLTSPNLPERSCKMMKGKMDCFYKYTEYRINKNNEVQYRMN